MDELSLENTSCDTNDSVNMLILHTDKSCFSFQLFLCNLFTFQFKGKRYHRRLFKLHDVIQHCLNFKLKTTVKVH